MDSSNGTVDYLWESYHDFKLWHGVLVAACGVGLLACVFISITVACMRYRKKGSVRYVYQTKQMKRKHGAQGSVFSVRSQGILELQSPHPNYNLASEEGIGRSQEQPMDQQLLHVRETSVSPEDGYQQVDAVTGGDVVYDEVDNNMVGKEGGVRESARSRNIHFARQSSSRASIRSESGIDARVNREEQFSRHKPTSVSTRSVIGARSLHRGNADPVISISFAEGRNDRRLGNSSTSLPQISIHQVRTPKHDASTPGFNPSVSVSQLSDNIPGFRDPELLGELDSDSLERLRIELPPDIYSSQILSTVKSPEWEYMNAGDEEGEGATAFRVITETSKSSHAVLNPGDPDCGDPDARMMLVVSGEDNDEVFYDLPTLTRGSRDNLWALFDDPGYNRGFAGQTGFAAKSNAHLYHTLEPPSEQGVASDSRRASSMARTVKYENVNLGEDMAEMEISGDSCGGDTQPEPGKTRVVRYENVILGKQAAGKSEIEMSTDRDRIPMTEDSKQVDNKTESQDSVRISAVDELQALRKRGYENVILDKQVPGRDAIRLSAAEEVQIGQQVASKSVTEDSDSISATEEGQAGEMKGGGLVASKSAMLGSVELLGFEDDELLALDPDIAACLEGNERGAD